MKPILAVVCTILMSAQTKPRARDLGIPFDGSPGPLNAITDIANIEVGHATLIEGDSVRTGVTAIRPRGKQSNAPAFAGWFSLNGNGEMTGTTWLEESGFLDSPVFITNTHSVGVVRDAYIGWQVRNNIKPATTSYGNAFWSLPVVAETYDGFLNDTNGFHVKPEHAIQALESATGGPVREGSVGGGTGMICFGFKGGIGTASRLAGKYKVAALVQCNCGARRQLRIAGVPVGQELEAQLTAGVPRYMEDRGSIIIVVATDAPLLPNQVKRLARRASLGLARIGSTSGDGSGDIFIAFSTANPQAVSAPEVTVSMLRNDAMGPLFEATVQAVEESIVNAMIAAEDMTGYQGHKVAALPHEATRNILRKYGRIQQ